jgi:hypothetical protein
VSHATLYALGLFRGQGFFLGRFRSLPFLLAAFFLVAMMVSPKCASITGLQIGRLDKSQSANPT